MSQYYLVVAHANCTCDIVYIYIGDMDICITLKVQNVQVRIGLYLKTHFRN